MLHQTCSPSAGVVTPENQFSKDQDSGRGNKLKERTKSKKILEQEQEQLPQGESKSLELVLLQQARTLACKNRKSNGVYTLQKKESV